ncbi:MAG TPA: hypothetical protein DCE41_33890 [Cytophagales bacterium]|nr:hypothetical protein [Cytophagales bacterium]HAA17987.1 hypothetical protein [Cytophagales bacterium]HAP64732.1 hypothetical protein [Cytophagales bacterium]
MFTGDDFMVLSDNSPLAGLHTNTPDKSVFSGSGQTGTVISRIEELYARLEMIREDSNAMSADEKRNYYEHLNAITNKQTELNEHLDSLKTASVSSYDTIKRKIEEGILDIELLLVRMRRV